MAYVTAIGPVVHGPYTNCVHYIRFDTENDITGFLHLFHSKESPFNLDHAYVAGRYARWSMLVAHLIERGMFGICELKEVEDVLPLYRDISSSPTTPRTVYEMMRSGTPSLVAGKMCLLPTGFSGFMKNGPRHYDTVRFTIDASSLLGIEFMDRDGAAGYSTTFVRAYSTFFKKVLTKPPALTEPVPKKLVYPMDVWSVD
ncbi:MAG: hypothetical protein E6R03_10180 [Hyphomicrobiaceae bacterium]|nr:MAG: hypothetical protein E6R03_10180 [Hyphomicrobiaceae bacterium]